jgi:hypothetical protein
MNKMKDNNIVLTPTVVDEIEFYVSNDGLITGLSISGLARLCGVDRKAIGNLLNAAENEGGSKTIVKWLESFTDKVFVPGVIGSNGAKIVDCKAAARVIRYYAYESLNKTEIAKHSYDKFAEIGIETWVKTITGLSEEDKLDKLYGLITNLYTKIDNMEASTVRYNNIRTTSIKLYPGLDYIHSEIEDGYLLESNINTNPFTLTEWLVSKGITLDNSRKHKLALLVSETYKTIVQKEPRKVKKKNEPGKPGCQLVNGFIDEEVPILEIALKKLFNML